MPLSKERNKIKYRDIIKLCFINLFILFILIFIIACSDQPDKDQTSIQLKDEVIKIQNNLLYRRNKISSFSDWGDIVQSKLLRIIVPYNSQFNEYIKTKSSSYINELKLIISFAKKNNLVPIIIPIKNTANLLPALELGLGDVIVAKLTINEARKELISLTDPVYYSGEQLIAANSFNKEISIDDLNHLKIGVRKDTSFWETINALRKEQDSVQLVELSQTITSDDKINKLLTGELDAIIEDNNNLIIIKEYRQDFKTVFQLTKEQAIVWGVRKNNSDLLTQLNLYLKSEKLRQQLPEIRLGDLADIKKSREIRLITRNNSSSYFLWKNKLMGFEYDLVKKFAKQQKLKLKILVAEDFAQMLEWLDNGHGDIISSGLVKTFERKKLPVNFSQPYLFVDEIIVQRNTEKEIKSFEELQGRTFYVQKSSSYWNTLISFQHQLKLLGTDFSIEIVPENMETEEIIKMVLEGKYDLTLADSHIIAIEKNWQSDLRTSLVLRSRHGHRWLVRKESENLLKELNKFIDKEYKSLFYNIIYNNYFKNSRNLFNADKRKINDNQISSYDKLIQSLAKEYHFDWRLIAAQINKESHFNPKAKSWAGAKGLLQVMPRTAKEVGISNLEKPENGLRAGLKYMAWVNDQLSDDLSADVRIWFTLAAYNAGLGHLKDARNLARHQGLNPDRWFGHVEKAFLLLSKPKYHNNTQYGYVRGIEPVNYIKKIQVLYEFYSKKYPEAPSANKES
ncbi:MAG: transporter substrate-binding domain-containing protein [gamma proteobacterium symbiont of Taylorina sp.]|nr:transporter substrate-binding domain-containing protein [gamma proteobacterium symbiont of Taylorina sp.]